MSRRGVPCGKNRKNNNQQIDFRLCARDLATNRHHILQDKSSKNVQHHHQTLLFSSSSLSSSFLRKALKRNFKIGFAVSDVCMLYVRLSLFRLSLFSHISPSSIAVMPTTSTHTHTLCQYTRFAHVIPFAM